MRSDFFFFFEFIARMDAFFRVSYNFGHVWCHRSFHVYEEILLITVCGTTNDISFPCLGWIEVFANCPWPRKSRMVTPEHIFACLRYLETVITSIHLLAKKWAVRRCFLIRSPFAIKLMEIILAICGNDRILDAKFVIPYLSEANRNREFRLRKPASAYM